VSTIGNHVGADVEDADLQRGVLVSVAQKDTTSFSFRASSARPNTSRPPPRFLDQRGKLLSLTASDKNSETFDANFLAISPR